MKHDKVLNRLRRAALKTYVIWAWAECTGVEDRSMYPLLKELFYNVLHCPMCRAYVACGKYESTYKRDKTFFERIHPEVRLYIGSQGEYYSFCPLDTCCTTASWFKMWVTTHSVKTRKIAAGEIARICWEEYKRLGG